jgi:hypothetical protein
MNTKRDPLEIMLELYPKVAPKLSKDLITRIFKLEERVQYDGNRGDIASEIKKIVQAAVEQRNIRGENNDTN